MHYTIEAFTDDDIRHIDDATSIIRALQIAHTADRHEPDETIIVCVWDEDGDEVERLVPNRIR